LAADLDERWTRDILPTLTDYIRIPALSPAFDPDWAAHGHVGDAVRLLRAWAEGRQLAGATVEVAEVAGRTPVIVVEIPPFDGSGPRPAGASADTVLLYGHLDKQPEMTGWRDGLGPWTPVRDGDLLYGRGGADDGYALFAALAAVEAVQAAGGRHQRLVVLIEASEESGSPDLPVHMAALSDRIGSPSLVIALDSGCGDYQRLWLTTSLRGLVGGTLSVELTTAGLHSGAYGGVVPSTFRVARLLLDRVEDATTGRVTLAAATVDIPADRIRQNAVTSALLADFADELPLVPGADVIGDRSVADVLLDRNWRPALEIIGADGLPPIARAGNVLRPRTDLAVSIRIPPGADPDQVRGELAAALTVDPPYGANVTFTPKEAAAGWSAPSLAGWLEGALEVASVNQFGAPLGFMGEGGTIPFMAMLGDQYPEAQFVITGVLGPNANAHGPNEFLHIPMAKRVTAAVAELLIAHAHR
jgi:acetylornithine deacetylase/succinyl-diaminopimelate desuccinylase-like protein